MNLIFILGTDVWNLIFYVRTTITLVREAFKKKMCKFHDNLQIGWGVMGSKHISKKIEIVTKVLGGVGEITKCHNFHTLKFCFETV